MPEGSSRDSFLTVYEIANVPDDKRDLDQVGLCFKITAAKIRGRRAASEVLAHEESGLRIIVVAFAARISALLVQCDCGLKVVVCV